MDDNLLMKAKWAAFVERASEEEPKVKILSVARALLDTMDYALDIGVISNADSKLPAELDGILGSVYAYLGDPIV